MLVTFGMQPGGMQYRRLLASFQRVFGATIFFGTDAVQERTAVIHYGRFNFMREARMWYSRDGSEDNFSGRLENVVTLSDEFYQEIMSHRIPTDLEAVKSLASAPAALDLFMWLSYRCFVAKGQERIPLFGSFGLVSQLGSAEYSRPRKFREKLQGWLDLVKLMWKGCPAKISSDGSALIVSPACAIIQAPGRCRSAVTRD